MRSSHPSPNWELRFPNSEVKALGLRPLCLTSATICVPVPVPQIDITRTTRRGWRHCGVRSYRVYTIIPLKLRLLLLLLRLLPAVSKWDEVPLPRPPGESLSSGGRPCCTQYGGQHPLAGIPATAAPRLARE